MTRPNPDLALPDLTRLWCHVEPLECGCWRWTGSVNDKGYGIVYIAGRSRLVHRMAYELLVGPLPTGLVSDHLCRNHWCANPLCLEPVTNRVNTLRGTSPNAINARKTLCDHGHPFNESNTYRRSDRPGRRECRACRRDAGTRRRIRDRARRLVATLTSSPQAMLGVPVDVAGALSGGADHRSRT